MFVPADPRSSLIGMECESKGLTRAHSVFYIIPHTVSPRFPVWRTADKKLFLFFLSFKIKKIKKGDDLFYSVLKQGTISYGYTAVDETKTLRTCLSQIRQTIHKRGLWIRLTSYDGLEKKNMGESVKPWKFWLLVRSFVITIWTKHSCGCGAYSVQVVDDVCVGLRTIFFLCTLWTLELWTSNYW